MLATILLLDLLLPQFVLPHVPGAMQVLLVSKTEADFLLCAISEKCGLLEVGTEELFIARSFLPVMEKHGQTQVQAEIGVHTIIMQQELLTESYRSCDAVATEPVY